MARISASKAPSRRRQQLRRQISAQHRRRHIVADQLLHSERDGDEQQPTLNDSETQN